ncbi:MAG: cytochrome C oxidase subunit IV family protein [Cytophagaceae bacterium]|jgi:cytochrome c oxidase subunit IV|nr:cytochrome C oxidase subunit IV family protein [Cytophagaceae bacterium]
MGHAHHGEDIALQVLPKDTAKIRTIWITTAILAGLTAVEFILAFAMSAGTMKTLWFVLLTFAKTFYIVGEFMHLKYEVKTLIWCIVLPTMFIMWFILAMLMEGDSIHLLREWVLTWAR